MRRDDIHQVNELLSNEKSIRRDIDVLQELVARRHQIGFVGFLDDAAEVGASLLQIADGSFPRQPVSLAAHIELTNDICSALQKLLLAERDACSAKLRELGVD